METQRLINARQAASILALRLPRLYELSRQGLIPGVVRVGDKSLRFDTAELEKFIKSGGVQPPAESSR